MNAENIKNLVAQGEGMEVEFKESYTELPSTIYQTICSFHNRRGGHILLGINKDEKTIQGVKESSIKQQMINLSNALNNPRFITPATYLSPEVIDVDGKKVIWIYVPEGSQAYSHKGTYYDRNEDGDYKLANQQLVAELYARKQNSFTENKVYPFLKMEHFEEELFDVVRTRVKLKNKNHIWLSMTNEEILSSARLRLVDSQTGIEGYTLAAALLFGKDNIIASVLPQYKSDALCRKDNMELYDDRDVITCNLIRAYSRLFDFINKHLPERPFIDGIQRLSYREMVFREVIPNFLIHREFSSAVPATMTIYKNTVVTENANRPYNWGIIKPNNFKPHPKNPTIAAMFREIGLVEELGYGVRNMFKYCPLYVRGAEPIIEEKDVFKVSIKYDFDDDFGGNNGGNNDGNVAVMQLSERQEFILLMIAKNAGITAKQMAVISKISQRTIERELSILQKTGIIKHVGAPNAGEWVIMEH